MWIRVHEVLVSLTGARIPMTAAAKWRAFWTENQATFKLATLAEKSRQDPQRTSGAFFNIPIQGKRVVFVIDRSGSMEWSMRVTNASGPTVAGGAKNRRQAKKITVAKQELWKVIQGLPADAKLNVIWYNAEPTQWKRKLVQDTARNKKNFKAALDTLRAVGATNICDSMKMALKLKSLVYGQHYDGSVDEVFLLSDGTPTAGEAREPNEIL